MELKVNVGARHRQQMQMKPKLMHAFESIGIAVFGRREIGCDARNRETSGKKTRETNSFFF